jgi:polyphosphate kinase
MSTPEPTYFNRELSWLEFNQRVLEEAHDQSNPALERLKFLCITSSNLDEFFMVRVGGLQILASEGLRGVDATGRTAAEQLASIAERTHRMVGEQYQVFQESITPLLLAAGIRRLNPAELTERQTQYLERHFDGEIGALITPMAVDGLDQFPLLMNLRLYLAVRLKPADDGTRPRFAVIPLGPGLSRTIMLPAENGYQFVLLEDVVGCFIQRLFPGERIAECIPFRITRNADMGVNEDSVSDLLQEMESILDARKKSNCVRLEIGEKCTAMLSAFLQKALKIGERETYHIPDPVNLADFFALASIAGHDELKYVPWPPQPSLSIDSKVNIFTAIRRGDALLVHPFESFDPVLRLIQEAAEDPSVLAIKQILYRTSRNSPIVAALQKAAENGKYVTVLVELKARFDEARNIEWAERLERAGVQVIYGVKGLKTHAKITIVVRREAAGTIRYMHFGTGNYNEITAQLYSDISYLTCNDDLGREATAFFNAITGYSQPPQFGLLAMAPLGLRDRLIDLIGQEAERSKHGQKSMVMAKMNSLVDKKMIDALYAASQAGTKISLNIRGICCLRPGVAGLSENITVTSIVDRYLEHSRIFYFLHGGEEKMFISSADWMPRNLDKRIELLVPVDEPNCTLRLKAILETYFQDTAKCRRLQPDGTYTRSAPQGKRKVLRSQEELYRRICAAIAEERQTRKTVFEPHKPLQSDY